MWGVGACGSLPKQIVLLSASAVVSSSVNGGSTTSASPSFSTPRAKKDLKLKQPIKIQGQQQQRILGSDIVIALQRAAAEKKMKMVVSMKNKNKKKAQGLTISSSSSSGDIQSGDVEGIRPIRIHGDWTTRLDNLETRLLLLSRSV